MLSLIWQGWTGNIGLKRKTVPSNSKQLATLSAADVLRKKGWKLFTIQDSFVEVGTFLFAIAPMYELCVSSFSRRRKTSRMLRYSTNIMPYEIHYDLNQTLFIQITFMFCFPSMRNEGTHLTVQPWRVPRFLKMRWRDDCQLCDGRTIIHARLRNRQCSNVIMCKWQQYNNESYLQ